MNQTINELRQGYWEEYHYNGQLMSNGNYINDLREGYWKEYYPNGRVMSEIYNIR